MISAYRFRDLKVQGIDDEQSTPGIGDVSIMLNNQKERDLQHMIGRVSLSSEFNSILPIAELCVRVFLGHRGFGLSFQDDARGLISRELHDLGLVANAND